MTTLADAARELADAERALHAARNNAGCSYPKVNAWTRYYEALAAYRAAEQKEKQA